MLQKVLFVDDEPQVLASLQRALRREPFEIVVAGSAQEALAILEREAVDVVVSDEEMPGMSGSELLAEIYRLYPDTVRMILTGKASLEGAIKAINEGQISRFFTKPANTIDLVVTIRQALQQKALMCESRRLLRAARDQSSLLEELERRQPGISAIQRDTAGRILIEEEQGDFNSLIQEIQQQVKKSERALSLRKRK